MNLQDVMKNLEESARLHRAYSAYFDVVVVSESHDETFRQVINYQLIQAERAKRARLEGLWGLNPVVCYL